MIRKPFVGRSREIASLGTVIERPGFEFIVITGRRRVGKTRILQEFSRGRNAIFLMCEKRKWQYNLDKFNSILKDHFNIPNPNFRSFRECFEFIVVKDPKAIVIIDEFTYLRSNKEIFGEFQGITDEVLTDSDITLILSGSYISILEREVLGKRSPLYGRTTGHIMVHPFGFEEMFEWFENISMIDAVRIFGVCDGIPKYLEFFPGKNILKEIEMNFFQPDSFLFREPRYLLEEELREPATYHQILEGISMGNRKVTKIADYSYIQPKDLSIYLANLREIGYIYKEMPVMGKKALYRIRDNLFRFWFRFTSPYFSEIDTWNDSTARENFHSNFDHYLGPIFEDICIDHVRKWNEYQTVGRWWYRENEIDIAGIDRSRNEVLFGECKWTKGKVDRNVLFDLKEKSSEFRWNEEKRNERFVIFSKSGFTNRLKSIEKADENVDLIDLEDMKKHFTTGA